MRTTTDAPRSTHTYRPAMTDACPAEPPGPILLCAGTDPVAAARLAEAAASLLSNWPVVVFGTWQAPPPHGPLDLVMDALYDTHADLRVAARHVAREAAQAACEVLLAHGLDVTHRVCHDERLPWQLILELGDEIDAGVIVAGTKERVAPRAGSLGREARALAHRTRRPLLLLPADSAPPGTDAPAIFAFDDSLPANHAIEVAAQLLRPRPAVVASVWQTACCGVGVALPLPEEIARKGADGLDEASRRHAADMANDGGTRLRTAGWSCETIALETHHNVPEAIIAAANERDAAIIVTGTRGRSRITATLLGSNAEEILRHAERPVLLTPPIAEQH